jgi:pimeloyl-ACP methyl ester carboxylesterase
VAVETRIVSAVDGTSLAVHLVGEGPPLLLLHGLFSNAGINWVTYGTAARLAEAGWRLIMPDLRGHGESASPATADRWPADVLAMDAEAVIAALAPGEPVVLAGYSLGARTVVRLLARGAAPRGAILAGMGLDGIVDVAPRSQWFIRLIEGLGGWPSGTPEALAQAFLKANIKTPENLLHLLHGQVATPESVLAGLSLPVLVVAGEADFDNGSARALAQVIPGARFTEIPGNHMNAVTRPQLATAMLAFLEALNR